MMIEGPAFPSIDFDPAGKGPRLTIAGHPLLLDQSQDVGEGEAHTVQTAKRVWDCAVVLAKFLEHRNDLEPAFLQGRTVVELGAGTGIAGIAAGYLGGEVTITDVAAVVGALEHNAGLNPAAVARVSAAALDWLDARSWEKVRGRHPGGIDVVLGADIVWVHELIGPMVRTMRDLCGEGTVVYFAYQSRSSRGDEVLFAALRENGFGWEKLPEAELHPEYRSAKIDIYVMRLEAASASIVYDGESKEWRQVGSPHRAPEGGEAAGGGAREL